MIQFVKDSLRELKHVVWPTRKETQKYFGLVLAMLVFFGLYLFIVSNIFSEVLFSFKALFSWNSQTITSSVEQQNIPLEADISINSDETVSVEGEAGTWETQ